MDDDHAPVGPRARAKQDKHQRIVEAARQPFAELADVRTQVRVRVEPRTAEALYTR